MSGEDADAGTLWTVSYHPGPADLLASYRAATRPKLFRYGPIAIVLHAAVGALVGWVVGRFGFGLPGPGAATGAIMSTMGFVALVIRAERRILDEEYVAAYCVPQTLTVGPAGFEHAFGDGRRLSASWKEVRKVGTTRSDFVIIVEEAKALAVPLRAFRSEGQRYLFVNLAGAWHAEATKAGDAAPRGPDQGALPSSPS